MKKVSASNLKSGNVKSCGCYRKQCIENGLNFKHGQKGTRFYTVWQNMKWRCLNKKNPRYKDYGGRGIKVCKNWLDFDNFYKDMHESYLFHCKSNGKRQTTLDRINNEKGYCKSNCRWATYKQQANNSRKTNGSHC